MSSSETSHDNNPNKTNEKPERKTYTNRRPPQQRRQPKPVYVVEDLREKLNRKKQEREEAQSKGIGPPPDPSYNFLRDPAREDESHQTEAKTPGRKSERHDYNPHFKPRQEGYGHERSYRGRGRQHFPRNQQRPQTIQPVNIKVELATSTGTRSCTFDEETKLPEIKHVPDRYDGAQRSYNQRNFYNKNSPRGRGGRGRARGRNTYNQPRGGFRKNDPNFNSPNDNLQIEDNWDEPETSNQSSKQKTIDGLPPNEDTSENWDQPETSSKWSKQKTIPANENSSENWDEPKTSNASSNRETVDETPSNENAQENSGSKELSDRKTTDEILPNKNEPELPSSANDGKEQAKEEINNEKNEGKEDKTNEEPIQTYVFEQTKEKSEESGALEELKDKSNDVVKEKN